MSDDYQKGFQRGQQDSIYDGKGSHAEWAGWQQGHILKERNEQQLRDFMAEGTATTSPQPDYSRLISRGTGSGLGIFVLLALAAMIEWPHLLVLGLEACITIVLASVIASPFLRQVARAAGVEHAGGFRRNFVVLLKSFGTYALVFFGLFLVLALLGKGSSGSFLGAFAHVGSAAVSPFPVPYGISRVTWPQVIGTVGLLQVPALAAFAWMLRRNNAISTPGARGFLKAMLSGLFIVAVFGGIAGAFVRAVFRML